MVQIILSILISSSNTMSNFISHMVQIIPSKFLSTLSRFFKLYIPHGSDNTRPVFLEIVFVYPFISHMVQIIPMAFCVVPNWIMALYIPHGSDNTRGLCAACYERLKLYIPHGSDNTCICSAFVFICYHLYIPHGSDNTECWLYRRIFWALYFISHMVQIIRYTHYLTP